MAGEAPLVVFLGHHKCATTWIHRVVKAVSRDLGWRIAYLGNAETFRHDLHQYVLDEDIDFVSYVNADIRQVKAVPSFRGFHVVRDPRDLIVSAYFSHLHSHATENWPALSDHRARLQSVSKTEGLLLEMDFSGGILRQLRRWDYQQSNVLELKLEHLALDPLNGFLRIFEFLGVLDEEPSGVSRRFTFALQAGINALHQRGRRFPRRKLAAIPAERLLGIVHENRFTKLAGGREVGEEDRSSHYRKGTSGDWKSHFENLHVAAFKDRYNDLLLELGYEKSADWQVLDPAR